MRLQNTKVRNIVNSCYIDALLVALFAVPSSLDAELAKIDRDSTSGTKASVTKTFSEHLTKFSTSLRNGGNITDDVLKIRKSLVKHGFLTKNSEKDQQDVCELLQFLNQYLDLSTVKLAGSTYHDQDSQNQPQKHSESILWVCFDNHQPDLDLVLNSTSIEAGLLSIDSDLVVEREIVTNGQSVASGLAWNRIRNVPVGGIEIKDDVLLNLLHREQESLGKVSPHDTVSLKVEDCQQVGWDIDRWSEIGLTYTHYVKMNGFYWKPAGIPAIKLSVTPLV